MMKTLEQLGALALTLALTFAAYTAAAADRSTPAPSQGGRILIAYFSVNNSTKIVANHLVDILKADLYEITPQAPYTAADLNYNTGRAKTEQNDPSARPAIAGSVENMGQYDVIFLGYPIWFGQAPKIISTFLESHDLSGKTIVPFCTSVNSGIGSSATNIHSLASGATWLEGQRFIGSGARLDGQRVGGSASRAEVESWVRSLPLH